MDKGLHIYLSAIVNRIGVDNQLCVYLLVIQIPPWRDLFFYPFVENGASHRYARFVWCHQLVAVAELSAAEKIEFAEDEEFDEDEALFHMIITFSDRDRNLRYLVVLKYNGQHGAVEQKAGEGHIIHELIMLMHSGDAIKLVSHELTHDEERQRTNVKKMGLKKIKLFFTSGQQQTNLYWICMTRKLYIITSLGSFANCKPEIIHRYTCGESPLVKKIITIDLHCSMQFEDSGDIEELHQE